MPSLFLLHFGHSTHMTEGMCYEDFCNGIKYADSEVIFIYITVLNVYIMLISFLDTKYVKGNKSCLILL